jgi:UPF0716 protein FxsA
MRRRIPWWVLAGLFVIVPIAEIYLLIQLGQVVGPWWTILILVADGVLGSWLVKREGARAWRELNEALQSGRMPSRELADGALVLVGGTLLVTPGFISDALGLFCILPVTRPLARRALTRVIARRLGAQPSGQRSAQGRSRQPGSPYADPQGPQDARRPGHEDVVRGEVID